MNEAIRKFLQKQRTFVAGLPIRFAGKIFCISFQRTGTTSTGQFFRDRGFRVASWSMSRRNDWTLKWFRGDYEAIFRSVEFKYSQVFEDDPWWCADFYKVLFHRFPASRFILLERDADQWFDSMVAHSKGKSLGNTHCHAATYSRMEEYYALGAVKEHAYTADIDNLLPLDDAYREHYKRVYANRHREVKLFFEVHDSTRLFNARIEDPKLWPKLGAFFRLEVAPGYAVHVNKTNKTNQAKPS